MRLTALGYVRFTRDIPEQAARHMQEELTAYAERGGYILGKIFIEEEEPGSSAFAALIEELCRSKTPIVVVPSMCHFAHLPGLQAAMKEHIERETGAQVIVMAETANSESKRPRQNNE
jgi:hypothetical protein